MYQYLKTHKLPKLIQNEMDNLIDPIIIFKN